MQPLAGITVVVVQVHPGGKIKELLGLFHLTQSASQNRVNGGRKAALVDTARLIEIIVCFQLLTGEIRTVQQEEHQHIRLFNHIVAVDALIRPVRVQREFLNGDGIDVNMRQMEVAHVLFKQLGLFIIGQIHFFCLFAPIRQFALRHTEGGVSIRLLALHRSQGFQRKFKGLFAHEICVGVVMYHHLELIGSHDAVIAVLVCFGVPIAACRQHPANFHQHHTAILIKECLIIGLVNIVPNTIGHAGRCLQLQASVLPQIAALAAADCGNGVECPLAVQRLCAFFCFRQRIIAEFQKALGCFRVIEKIERQTADFTIPERIAVVCFAGQSLCSKHSAVLGGVQGLVQLENAEANSLLIFGITVNLNIRRLPLVLPPRGGVLFQCLVVSSSQRLLCLRNALLHRLLFCFCLGCQQTNNTIHGGGLPLLQTQSGCSCGNARRAAILCIR